MPELSPFIEAFFRGRDVAIQQEKLAQDRLLKEQELKQQNEQFKQTLERQKLEDMAQSKFMDARRAVMALEASKLGSEGIIPGTPGYITSPEASEAAMARFNTGKSSEPDFMSADIPGLGTIKFKPPTLYGEAQTAIKGPLQEQAFKQKQQLEMLKNLGDFTTRTEVEKLKRESQENLQTGQQKFLSGQWEENRKNAVRVANIRAQSRGGIGDVLKYSQQVNLAERAGSEFRRDPVIRAYDQVKSAVDFMEEAEKNPSGVSNTAMITTFAKVNDALSSMNAVRESEFRNAAAAQSIGERIKSISPRLTTGEMLTNKTVKQFIQVARQYRDALSKTYTRKNRGLLARMKAAGISSDLIQANVDPEKYLSGSGMVDLTNLAK